MSDRFDLVVIGLGSAGIAAARFAAGLGVRVAAVERARIGGDCLWTGCVPSKALLAAARAAHHVRMSGAYGVRAGEPRVDGPAVWDRIRRIQDEIASHEDGADAISALGIDLFEGEARLLSPTSIRVDDRRITARRVIVCTGSRPAVPAVPGLREAGFLTSETLWALTRIPERLVVLGGGPIGCEISQAMRRLGAHVTLVQAGPRLLARDEPELTATLADVLRREGIEVVLDANVERVRAADGVRTVHATAAGRPATWSADEVLVATGRAPNVEGLGLEDVGVAIGRRGIVVDERLRTSVRTIYAAGDVAGRHLFTHSAAHDASTAVRNMLFPGSAKAADLVPWCTFTDPELAHVGSTIAEAEEAHGARSVRVHRSDLASSDRGRADGLAEGRLLVVTAKDRIVGAHILAPAAGEIVHAPALAVSQRLRLRDLSGLVHVYPTLSWQTALLAAGASYERARRLRFLLSARRRP